MTTREVFGNVFFLIISKKVIFLICNSLALLIKSFFAAPSPTNKK